VDIRTDKTEKSLLDITRQSLSPKDGSPKTMPTLLLYDGIRVEYISRIRLIQCRERS